MKNSIILLLILLSIIGIGTFLYISSDQSVNNEPGNISPTVESGNVQKITLGMKNYNYYPNIITVKEGLPVEITLDSSVIGCYRSFTINDFGVRAYSSSPDQKITFTPTKKGTFRFACSMGMGIGTIVVD